MSQRADSSDFPKDTSQRAYFPALDGLRLVSCLLVIVGHSFVFHPLASQMLGLSKMGVHVFFSLSGFLITTLLLREHTSNGRIDLRAFYIRRALRIFPVYYSAVALSLFLLWLFPLQLSRAFGLSGTWDLAKMAPPLLLFVANWIPQQLPTTLDVLWSISVEEQFYLCFPWALVLSRSRFPALWPILLGLALCWATRAVVAATSPESIDRNTLATGDHLLFGAVLAHLAHSSPRVASFLFRRGTLSQVGMLGLTFGFALLVPQSPAQHFVRTLVSALLSTGLVATLAFGNGQLGRILALPAPRFLGQLTYATYVFHMFAVGVAWWVAAQVTSDVHIAAPLRAALAIPPAFALGYVSRVVLETHPLRLKARFSWARASPDG